MQRLNVVSLDDALRLTRTNTLWSSSYKTKAQRLAANQARQLQILEERLFQARRSLSICSTGQMQKPEGHFVCLEGQIWYYFSEPNRKFVLLDFDLSTGGSGGLPIPSGDDAGLFRVLCSPSYPARKLWVARAYRWVGSRGSKFLTALIKSRRTTQVYRPLTAYILMRQRSRISEFGATEKNSATLQDNKRFMPLPEWSILAPFVTTPEQLQNRYARSILVGERLCRLAAQTSLANALQANRRAPDIELFNESTLVLGIMFATEQTERPLLRNFKIAKALPNILLEDDRLLSLVRCELTAKLSIFTAQMAGMNAREFAMYRSNKMGLSSALRVMKKYSLLADFISLSECLFEVGRPQFDIEALCKDYKSDIKDRRTLSTLREMGMFDCSIHGLVAELADDEPLSRNYENLSSLHDRLLGVTCELFEFSQR